VGAVRSPIGRGIVQATQLQAICRETKRSKETIAVLETGCLEGGIVSEVVSVRRVDTVERANDRRKAANGVDASPV
jgi:hypothetical protein